MAERSWLSRLSSPLCIPAFPALDLAVVTGGQGHLSQTSHKLARPQAFCMAPGTKEVLRMTSCWFFLASFQFNWDLKTTLSVMFNPTFMRKEMFAELIRYKILF